MVDPVLDYDPVTGRLSTDNLQQIIDHLQQHNCRLEWILETHVHADHLSAARPLQAELGGKIGIGHLVTIVQEVFGKTFNCGTEVRCDGTQFDHLFRDEERFQVGTLNVRVMATPGHTPACVTYVVENAAFIGDTLFMPDYGTARTDFPGGDAEQLYHSIQKILALPEQTTLYICHDYGTPTRSDFLHQTTVGQQRAANIHIQESTSLETFVYERRTRDATLSTPRLLFPAVQFNIRGGAPPRPESNGISYFKIPLQFDTQPGDR